MVFTSFNFLVFSPRYFRGVFPAAAEIPLDIPAGKLLFLYQHQAGVRCIVGGCYPTTYILPI